MPVTLLTGNDGSNTLQGTAGDDLIYGFDPNGPQGGASAIAATRVATGLSQPLFVTAAPGDGSHLFVVEKTGQIKLLDLNSGQLLAAPFLDVSSAISTAGEGGLLGLAFDPDYAAKGQFYVNVINTAGDTEIRRYTRSDIDANRADPSTGTLILAVDQPATTNHKAGWLDFGPDGYLYAALGDGGGGGDPLESGQNIDSLLGKMLRLDVGADGFPNDPLRNYAIPAGNPFAAGAGADEIWALGLRNPWRNSFDRGLGDFYIADVGQGTWEEVNLGIAGANYGWNVYEGPDVFEPGPLGPGTLTFPIYSYNHAGAGKSITGGYVYRGESEGLHGQYFFADFVTGGVSTLHFDGSSWIATDRTAQITPDFGQINSPSSFGEDARGNLYIVDIDGEIFRLTPQWNSADLADTLHGGDGADQIFAGGGDDTLFGEADNDTLWGMSGNDHVYGGAGRDNLFGGSGNDYLLGGADLDFLTGQAGADRFVFDNAAFAEAQAGVFDRITDYNQGNTGGFNFAEGDLIDLSALLAAAHASGQPTSSLVRFLAGPGRDSVRIQVDPDGTVNGANWVTIAGLDGVHPGHIVQVMLDASDIEALVIPARHHSITDFNPDSSDIVWQRLDGTLAMWTLNGPNIAANAIAGNIGPQWQITGTADYNGDHSTDLLSRGDDGNLLMQTLVNNHVQTETIIGGAGNEWQVLGSSDFNNDGRDDILWQRNDGTLAIWDMNGPQIIATPIVGALGLEWKLQGTGDYNGDGAGDLLWRRADGTVAMWEINNNHLQKASIVGGAGNEWQIVGSGDFNGDHKTDILWQRGDGALAIWDMNGAQIQSFANLITSPGAGWTLEGTADYNHDGTADLLWQHAGDGALHLDQMVNNQVDQHFAAGPVGTEWQLL